MHCCEPRVVDSGLFLCFAKERAVKKRHNSTKKKEKEVTSLDDEFAQTFTPINRADKQPASYDGFIRVELSREPVPYHVVKVFSEHLDENHCHAMAVAACRMGILTLDVIRGKLSANGLRRAASAKVIERLQRLAFIIEHRMNRDDEYKAKLKYPPVMPLWLSGAFISSTCLEICMQLSIGHELYLANLRFEQVGCRWVCTFADIG